jgi:hypothetical protein
VYFWSRERNADLDLLVSIGIVGLNYHWIAGAAFSQATAALLTLADAPYLRRPDASSHRIRVSHSLVIRAGWTRAHSKIER